MVVTKTKKKRIGYEESKKSKILVKEESECEKESEKVPEHLTCTICGDILKQAVLTKCGHVFCDECIRNELLETKTCPQCEKHNSPDDLFADSNLRQVFLFK